MAVGIAAFGGAVIGRPIVPLLLYISIFFVFAQTSYGSLDIWRTNHVYGRGTGQVFFPLLYWSLLIILAWTWMGRAFSFEDSPPMPAVLGWLLAWLGLLVAHVVVGAMNGVEIADALGGNGFVGVVWMAPLVLLMVWAGASRKPVSLLMVARLLVLAALGKAAFGLGRWAFLGGDPANIYANTENLSIRLTYFDIADSLVCVLGLAVALALLLVKRSDKRSAPWDWIYIVTVVAALACIMLSYRRTAWGGVLLVMIYFFIRMQPRWRLPVLTVGVPVVLVGLSIVMGQRLNWRDGSNPFEKFFFDLVSSGSSFEGTRVLELRLAWEAFTNSPILGIGSWGKYASSKLIPWQDPVSAGSFLHSGVLHLTMKAGLVGLFLTGGLLWAFARQARSLAASGTAEERALVMAGVAGLLFMVPDFLFGTPIGQVRTMQLLALCLGLPCLVAAAQWALAQPAGKRAPNTLHRRPYRRPLGAG
jgi:O-antigen ligase